MSTKSNRCSIRVINYKTINYKSVILTDRTTVNFSRPHSTKCYSSEILVHSDDSLAQMNLLFHHISKGL